MGDTQTIEMEGSITGADAPSDTEPKQEQERPEWLPEKFKNPEDMANAYSELEKQFTQQRQNDKTEEQNENTELSIDDAQEAVENVGLDFAAMTEDYTTNGQLSEDNYKLLDEKGIPKEVVDAYIEGQKAVSENMKMSVFSSVGGEENYKQITDWASNNMSESEKTAYNNSVNSGDLEQAKLAIDALAARYKLQTGTTPNLVGGKASESMDTYTSWAEVTSDMKDPKYAKDPAYRAKVEGKLGRSKSIT